MDASGDTIEFKDVFAYWESQIIPELESVVVYYYDQDGALKVYTGDYKLSAADTGYDSEWHKTYTISGTLPDNTHLRVVYT